MIRFRFFFSFLRASILGREPFHHSDHVWLFGFPTFFGVFGEYLTLPTFLGVPKFDVFEAYL